MPRWLSITSYPTRARGIIDNIINLEVEEKRTQPLNNKCPSDNPLINAQTGYDKFSSDPSHF